MPTLVYGVPWQSPFFLTQAMDSLLALERPAGWEVAFVRGTGWCSARRHIDICEKALAKQADYICILGADQLYDPDLLCRLTQRLEEGYEIVCAMVNTRGYLPFQDMKPFETMAWRWKTPEELGEHPLTYRPRQFRSLDRDGDMIHRIRREDGPIQRVNFIGSGVVCFHRDHLLALKPPWFYETVQRETQARIANMDIRTLWRFQVEAHARVWVDTTIRVRHLHLFAIDDSFSERFADWALGQGNPDPAICAWRDPFRDEVAFVQTNGMPMPRPMNGHPVEEKTAHAGA